MKGILYIMLLTGALLAESRTASCQAKQFGDPKGFVYDLSFSKGGSLLAITEGKTATLYDIQSGQLMKSLQGAHTAEVLTVNLSTDSTQLASGGKDGQVFVWDLLKGEATALEGHQGVVTSVKFHPSGHLLISAGSDNKVFVHELSSRKILFTLAQHTDDVTTIAISPDGHLLASGSGDKSICLWELHTGKLLSQLKHEDKWVRSLVFGKDGRRLFAGGDDGRFRLWNVEKPESPYLISERKIKTGWTLGLDLLSSGPEDESIAYAGLNGRIGIKTAFTNYKYKIGTTAHKILFQPNQGIYLKVAVATNGKGVLLIDAAGMNETDL